MGLVIFGAMALYLVIAIFVVTGAISHARKNGKSVKRWGWGAALVMYLIPFWDWIPTVAMHQYYCATEAGFWVYKTPEQWSKENPGVMETLVTNKGVPNRNERFDDGHGEKDIYLLNERFNWIVTQQDFSVVLPIIRSEQQVKDAKTTEVLARYVNFSTGNSVKNTVGPPGPMKFWLHRGHCAGGERNKGLMYSFEHSIRGAEK
jgi:hypothetical protein